MKYFIITIDTEGDNLWSHKIGQPITTENAKFIPCFHDLCKKYNFKPVYLVNYEMANDKFFINFAKRELKDNNCEIGLHLHAWNNPPLYELLTSPLPLVNGLPYLIEYPKDIMREKIVVMTDLLKDTFESEIISHRSGRWAMNQNYFDLLIENDIKTDCSVTPHISWETSPGFTADSRGSDYSSSSEIPYFVNHSSTSASILEIPVTVRKLHVLPSQSIRHPRGFIKELKEFVVGKSVWLRPNGRNLSDMLSLVDNIQNSNHDYLMFMLHSSELMPCGSPAFKSSESIENFYKQLEILFNTISKTFSGVTIGEYYSNISKY